MLEIEPRACLLSECSTTNLYFPAPLFFFFFFCTASWRCYLCMHPFKVPQLTGFYISIELWNHHQCTFVCRTASSLKRSHLTFSHQHKAASIPANHGLLSVKTFHINGITVMVYGEHTRASASIPSFSLHWCSLVQIPLYLRNFSYPSACPHSTTQASSASRGSLGKVVRNQLFPVREIYSGFLSSFPTSLEYFFLSP